MKKALIIHNKLSENALQDELDVLDQANVVEKEFIKFGYEVYREDFDLNMQRVKDTLLRLKPDFIFNLVETIDGKGFLSFMAPALFESMDIPFSGSGSYALYLTSNKMLTKEAFVAAGIPTGEWYSANETDKLNPAKRYIVKPFGEDASVGISEDAVFYGNDPKLKEYIDNNKSADFFIEEYIHGREFNISILGGKKGPRVMPPAEMKFYDYPEDKPFVLGYKAKWEEDSFEYKNTRRTFDFTESDKPLIEKVKQISLDCWKKFNLRGYVRVDIRVDEKNNPYVLEINANPCISPDAGFYIACNKGGVDFNEVISEIIYDGYK